MPQEQDPAIQQAMLYSLERQIDPSKTWSDDEVEQLTELLNFATTKALMKRYPFGHEEHVLPARYNAIVVRVAVELYNKIGAEGQTGHTENGIGRTWESADDARSLLEYIPSCVGVTGLANNASEQA